MHLYTMWITAIPVLKTLPSWPVVLWSLHLLAPETHSPTPGVSSNTASLTEASLHTYTQRHTMHLLLTGFKGTAYPVASPGWLLSWVAILWISQWSGLWHLAYPRVGPGMILSLGALRYTTHRQCSQRTPRIYGDQNNWPGPPDSRPSLTR